ncbi:progranulin-like, partial [Anableps anableps]
MFSAHCVQTLQMELLFLALLGLSTALICPDRSKCRDKNTCCKNIQGGYSCCPLPHAECCSDHIHCCYEGTLCDLVLKKCVNKTVSLPLIKRLPTKQRLSASQFQVVGGLKAVMCPDHESQCPDDTTCCQLYDSSWACCPLPKAVCCEDKRHCCPEGSKCDPIHLKCVSPSLKSFPMLEKLPTLQMELLFLALLGLSTALICPDRSKCRDKNTCCKNIQGGYSCCPLPHAECCSDHIHCCYEGTLCDLVLKKCVNKTVSLPLIKRLPTKQRLSASQFQVVGGLKAVMCPDHESQCPDDTTCCQLYNSSWACCPLPKAVCCEDKRHCCPEGSKCD